MFLLLAAYKKTEAPTFFCYEQARNPHEEKKYNSNSNKCLEDRKRWNNANNQIPTEPQSNQLLYTLAFRASLDHSVW